MFMMWDCLLVIRMHGQHNMERCRRVFRRFRCLLFATHTKFGRAGLIFPASQANQHCKITQDLLNIPNRSINCDFLHCFAIPSSCMMPSLSRFPGIRPFLNWPLITVAVILLRWITRLITPTKRKLPFNFCASKREIENLSSIPPLLPQGLFFPTYADRKSQNQHFLTSLPRTLSSEIVSSMRTSSCMIVTGIHLSSGRPLIRVIVARTESCSTISLRPNSILRSLGRFSPLLTNLRARPHRCRVARHRRVSQQDPEALEDPQALHRPIRAAQHHLAGR